MATNNEMLVQALIDGSDVSTYVPQSRNEQFLKDCACGEECKLTPTTRFEYLLHELNVKLINSKAKIEPITITANGTYNAPDNVDGYNPVNVNINVEPPEPSDIDTLIDGSITNIVSGVEVIKDYAFSYCRSLVSASFPNATGDLKSGTFSSCKLLKSVILPKIQRCDFQVFMSDSLLQKVDFGSLTILPYRTSGNATFYGCTSLKTLIIRTSSVCTLMSSAHGIGGTLIGTSETEGFIYVPDELVEDYKVATNWSVYANKIKGLSELPIEE